MRDKNIPQKGAIANHLQLLTTLKTAIAQDMAIANDLQSQTNFKRGDR
jgi:hypothetical protein